MESVFIVHFFEGTSNILTSLQLKKEIELPSSSVNAFIILS